MRLEVSYCEQRRPDNLGPIFFCDASGDELQRWYLQARFCRVVNQRELQSPALNLPVGARLQSWVFLHHHGNPASSAAAAPRTAGP